MNQPRQITLQGITDVGCTRSENEDCFIIQPLNDNPVALNDGRVFETLNGVNILAAVSDGMGGAAAGEVASSTGLTVFRDYLLANKDRLERAEPQQTVEIVEAAVQSANSAIYQASQDNPDQSGMGATVTAFFVKDDIAYFFQIGDSRAYTLRNDTWRKITRDQSFVGQLLEMGTITEAQAAKHPQRNLILQALGSPNQLKVDVTFLPLCKGDFIMMCSDGLYSEVKPDALRALIKSMKQNNTELYGMLSKLVESANDAGGKDNITIVGIQVGDGFPEREPGEDPRYRRFPFLTRDKPIQDVLKALR